MMQYYRFVGLIFVKLLFVGLVFLSPRLWADNELLLVTHNAPPYSSVSATGEMQGLSVEVADLLFENIGMNKKWLLMSRKRVHLFVAKTPNSCVFPSQRNQEREASFKWVSPMLITRFAFFSNADSTTSVRTLADLTELRIVSTLGSGVKEYLDGFGISTMEVVQDEQAASMLALGRADLWAADVLSAKYLTNFTDITFGKAFKQQFIFFTSISAMACNRNVSDAMISLFQSHLSELYRSKKIADIEQKYQ